MATTFAAAKTAIINALSDTSVNISDHVMLTNEPGLAAMIDISGASFTPTEYVIPLRLYLRASLDQKAEQSFVDSVDEVETALAQNSVLTSGQVSYDPNIDCWVCAITATIARDF